MDPGALPKIVLTPTAGKGLTTGEAKSPFFTPEIIPADTYDMYGDVATVTVRNILATTTAMPEEAAYELTKGVFEHIADIQASHATAKKHISFENSHIGVGIPFHEGAERYYREMGWK